MFTKPKPSKWNRKRNVKSQKKSEEKKPAKIETTNTQKSPTKLSPELRILQYPDQNFEVLHEKLFCKPCKKFLNFKKKDSINDHVSGPNHQQRNREWIQGQLQKEDEANTFDQLRSHTEHHRIPDEIFLWRVEVVAAFLEAGLPLHALSRPRIKALLEQQGHPLINPSNLKQQTIPYLQMKQKFEIKKLFDEKNVAIIFDGTTRVGEVFGIVCRAVSDDFNPIQKVLRVASYERALTSENVAAVLTETISVDYGWKFSKVVAFMHDSCSVNLAALRCLQPFYHNACSMRCIAHALSNCGSRLVLSIADSFIESWVAIFSHSCSARSAIGNLLNDYSKLISYSRTRWWSKLELFTELANNFEKVIQFLEAPWTFSANSLAVCRQFLKQEKKQILEFELFLGADIGEVFIAPTYELESDSATILVAGRLLSSIRDKFFSFYPRRASSFIEQMPTATKAEYMNRITVALFSVKNYFFEKFGFSDHDKSCEFGAEILRFKAAEIFDPQMIKENTSIDDVYLLSSFPFVTDNLIFDLKKEFLLYKNLAISTQNATDLEGIKSWWKLYQNQLPHLSATLKSIILHQPSSAAVERVFSLLELAFTSRQNRLLDDVIELTLQFQFL